MANYYYVKNSIKPIPIGFEGENDARTIVFDISRWIEDYGNGTALLVHQRPGDAEPYPCATEQKAGTIEWAVQQADLVTGGYGRAQISYKVGDNIVARSPIYKTVACASISAAEAGEPGQDWINDVLDAAAQAETSATNAANSAETAKQAETAATQAATSAASDANAAAQSEANASKSASAAAGSATAAAGSAETAQTAATTATDAAGQAQASQTAAAGSASAAAESATQAAGSQTAAKNSEDAAAGSATDAAESASAALTSQNAAKTSEDNAKDSETQAASSASAAASSATAANQSKTDAESAKTAAEAAKTAAETARSAAEAAQAASESAKTAAASFASAAAGSATSAQTHATTAQQAAETATSAAETAAEDAAGAVSEQLKEDVQGIVDNLDGLSEAIAIKETATGEVISVSDSADYRLMGLKLYGKSVQEGELPPNNQPNDPLPTTPVPIENAGDSGNITLTIANQNFAKNVTYTSAVSNFGTLVYVTAFSIMPKVGQTYTLSVDLEAESSTKAYWNKYLGFSSDSSFVVNPGKARYSRTITFTKEFQNGVALTKSDTSDGVNITPSNFMLTPASVTDVQFVESQSQTLTYPTPNGLLGIPVESGGNYTDAEGQQWVCDEVDLTGTNLVTKIARVDAASFTQNNITSISTGSRFSYKPPTGIINESNALCNYLAYRNIDSFTSRGNYVATDENRVNIRLTEDITLEEFQQKYPDLYVLYQLETPVESDIVGVPDFSGYKLNTTITTDSSPAAGIEVNYVADTKTYIDNKIAAISEAILGGTTNGNV